MKEACLLAAVAALALTAHAVAADMTTAYPPEAPASAPVAYNWSGGYIGLQTGYDWAKVKVSASPIDFSPDGMMLGGYLGWNWQRQRWVFGIEGDAGYSWADVAPTGVKLKTGWQGAVRGRVGYLVDPTWLIYGAGGVAFSQMRIDPPVNYDKTYTGWTLGAGVEHAFTQHLLGRVDFRYSDYGSELGPFGTKLDLTESSLRVGIAYKF